MKKLLGPASNLLAAAGFSACLLIAHSQAGGAELMPSFSTVPTGWTTDRYDPTSFSNVGTFASRSNVLGIEITSATDLANRPAAYQFPFYDTQGRGYAVSGGVGDSISADLWIEEGWGSPASGSIRTDMWGELNAGGPTVTDFPIIGFTNYGGAARFRIFDGDLGSFVDLANPVLFGQWNSLSFTYSGSSILYYVNGSLAYTDSTIDGTAIGAIVMQAFNFADPSLVGAVPVDYTAHWSNVPGGAVPDRGTTFALLGAACVGLGWFHRRSIVGKKSACC